MGRALTSFVDVVGEDGGGSDQYTGDSTGTTHEHQYKDYKLRHMRLARIILRRSGVGVLADLPAPAPLLPAIV
jgi:hypothetical protein